MSSNWFHLWFANCDLMLFVLFILDVFVSLWFPMLRCATIGPRNPCSMAEGDAITYRPPIDRCARASDCCHHAITIICIYRIYISYLVLVLVTSTYAYIHIYTYIHIYAYVCYISNPICSLHIYIHINIYICVLTLYIYMWVYKRKTLIIKYYYYS